MRPVRPESSAHVSTAGSEAGLSTGVRRAVGSDALPLHPSGPEEIALQALVASARHELRSPLQSIQGFADLLLAESYGALGAEQRAFVEHIVQSSADLSRALDACFDLVHAELLHGPSAVSRVPLRTAVTNAVTMAQAAGERPIELHLDTLDANVHVELDVQRFQRAIAAIMAALSPPVHAPVVCTGSLRDCSAQLSFGPDASEPRTVFRDARALSARAAPSRSILWLRLARALLDESAVRLEVTERCERIRLVLPLP